MVMNKYEDLFICITEMQHFVGASYTTKKNVD